MKSEPIAHPESTETSDRSFFGQPRPLGTIVGVEVWERFSFYGMQVVMLLYLATAVSDGGLGLGGVLAASVIGAYGGAVYLSTIIGAWIADRVLGSERVLFYSACLIMVGHIALAILPDAWGVLVGLVLVALGSGGLKANSTSIIGTFYAEKDPRRDAGFSIFYLGINLGAFFGPLITGLAEQLWGYHFAFGAAAVGMAIGLTQYAIGRRGIPEGARAVPNPLPHSQRLRWILIACGALVVIVLAVVTGVLTVENIAIAVIAVTVVASLAYFAVILASKRVDRTERRRVVAFIPLFVASVCFWSLYQQQFSVVTLYAQDQLNLNLFGWQMPVEWVQAINPIFIILLSGAFAALWMKWGERQPSTPAKFGAANIITGIAFFLFLPFANGGPNSTPLLALVVILFVFTVAELLLSPVGLSGATKLSPRAFRTQMVALFYLSVALGTAISGQLAVFYDPHDQVPYFTVLGSIAVVLGVSLMVAAPGVRRLMGGIK